MSQSQTATASDVGLRKGALTSPVMLVIFACSLISPTMCLTGVMPYLADRTGWTMALAMAIAGILNFFWAVSYTDMVKIYPSCGSHYAYIRGSLGSVPGFLLGFGVLPTYNFACGAHVIVFGTAFQLLWDIPFWIIALVYCIIIVLVSIRGISLTSWVAALMFLAECIIILCVSYSAIKGTWPLWSEMAPKFLWPQAPFTMSAVMFASVLSVYNYIGFASITSLVEESTPDLVAKAMNWSIAIVILVYVIALVAVPLVFASYTDIAASDTAYMDAVTMLWDKYWPIGLVGVLLSTFTCSLACINTAARMMYDMARDGCLPKWFAKIHKRFQTPWSGLVFSGVFYFIAALAIPYVIQVELIVIVMLLAYIGVALSNLIINKNINTTWGLIKSRIMPVVGIVLAIYLLAIAEKTAWIYSLCWFALIIAYTIYLKIYKPKSLEKLDMSEM